MVDVLTNLLRLRWRYNTDKLIQRSLVYFVVRHALRLSSDLGGDVAKLLLGAQRFIQLSQAHIQRMLDLQTQSVSDKAK